MPIDGEVNQTCHPERGKKEGEEGGGGNQNIGGKRERDRETERERESGGCRYRFATSYTSAPMGCAERAKAPASSIEVAQLKPRGK